MGTVGQRPRLRVPDNLIEELPADLREQHQKFRDLADRHVAHRVDDTEQVLVQLVFQEDPPAAVGIGLLEIHLVSLSAEDSLPLAEIAERLADGLGEEIERRKQELLDETNKADVAQMVADARTGPAPQPPPTGEG
jgi:hypothetical protein